MNEQKNINSNIDTATKAELAEWMLGLLLSDERLSEDALDEIRRYLTDGKDSELKKNLLNKIFLEAFQHRDRGARAAKSALVEELWPRIVEALELNRLQNKSHLIRKSGISAKPHLRPAWHRVAMRVAAVVIPVMAIAGVTWLWFDRTETPDPQPLLANVEVSVPEGGQKRIVLPDGSQVWANSSTTVKYNDDFSKQRMVTLDGEAFFSIVRDTLAPFRVQAGEMVVEVLGTEFNVTARSGESTAEVVLAKGSVKVETPHNKAMQLTPNERLSFNTLTSRATIDRIAAETVSSWRITDLRMQGMPLADALERIASYYGLELSVVGTLPPGDLVDLTPAGELSVDDVLDVVRGITGNFNYQLTEHEVIVQPVPSQE